ncbi:hypothetical protein ATANTOWER_002574 [Ataeniobius toweri]|uniref:FHA domain-containing protein n=1 Tax=Ataeniobius toweri TaxID=208326 RepID=A0ABU7AIF7_9TELE|nr:hypothetical protein [Ataeniobius toweri]
MKLVEPNHLNDTGQCCSLVCVPRIVVVVAFMNHLSVKKPFSHGQSPLSVLSCSSGLGNVVTFYLQDTKSSNGTFINSQRLSRGSEESPPCEVLSGDIIQFGVDVTENTRKVTHGCIVSTIKLFLPDGMEARRRSDVIQAPLPLPIDKLLLKAVLPLVQQRTVEWFGPVFSVQ